jgi:hypothetical protein
MVVRLKGLLGSIALLAASTMVSSVTFVDIAAAQTTPAEATNAQPTEADSLQDAFLRAYYRYDGNYFSNRGVLGQLNWLLGPFIENEITGDGRAVNRIYRDALRQQTANDPTIRTPDLENPYNTSLLLIPSLTPASSLSTSNEPIPQTPPPVPVAPAAAPQTTPAAPAAPVPGLW